MMIHGCSLIYYDKDFTTYEKKLMPVETIVLTAEMDEPENFSEIDTDFAVLDESIDAHMIDKLYLSDDLSTGEMEEVEEFIYEVGWRI